MEVIHNCKTDTFMTWVNKSAVCSMRSTIDAEVEMGGELVFCLCWN